MNGIEPYWYKLISYWVKEKNRMGLTIPFIIGAKQYFDVDSRPQSVTELLTIVKDSNIDETIVLNNCNDIGEFVLGIDNQPFSLSGIEFKSGPSEHCSLKATTSAKLLGDDFESICKSLEKKYDNPLEKEYYSKVDFKWNPFTETDINMIEEAKKR